MTLSIDSSSGNLCFNDGGSGKLCNCTVTPPTCETEFTDTFTGPNFNARWSNTAVGELEIVRSEVRISDGFQRGTIEACVDMPTGNKILRIQAKMQSRFVLSSRFSLFWRGIWAIVWTNGQVGLSAPGVIGMPAFLSQPSGGIIALEVEGDFSTPSSSFTGRYEYSGKLLHTETGITWTAPALMYLRMTCSGTIPGTNEYAMSGDDVSVTVT